MRWEGSIRYFWWYSINALLSFQSWPRTGDEIKMVGGATNPPHDQGSWRSEVLLAYNKKKFKITSISFPQYLPVNFSKATFPGNFINYRD